MWPKEMSLMCWLKGHKWHTTEDYYNNGELWWKHHFFVLKYCARCGKPSPATKPVVEGKAE